MKTSFQSYRPWLWLQAVALLWGNYVGWSTIYREVQHYCAVESRGLEALFTFGGTATTNPLLSPCFWGTLAFGVSLVWTIRLLYLNDPVRFKLEFKRLLYLLLGSTVFAFLNNIPVFYNYLTKPDIAANTCSPDNLLTNPFLTSCFLGFSAFALASILALIAKSRMEVKNSPS